MNVLELHEIDDFSRNLDRLDICEHDIDVITFDDGLYSQYKNIEVFRKFDMPLYFFISTDIVCPENVQQNEEVITAEEAHIRYRTNGDLSNYMKWSQIIEISKMKNCYVGGHGHTHRDFRELTIHTQHYGTTYEVSSMIRVFNEHNIGIDSFAFPYNYEALGYRHFLKQFNVKKFFGSERINIETIRAHNR